MNRRDLMKFFAVGTVIAPLGSTAVAKLIEVPNIEPVKLATVIDPRQIKSFSVTLEMFDGTMRTMPCAWPSIEHGSRPLAGELEIAVRIGARLSESPVSSVTIVKLWGQSKA